MFLGHFGVGLAGKRAVPGLSLGTLFLATQWADLTFFPLTLAGIEQFRIRPGAMRVTPLEFSDYPVSHSLLGLAVWGALLGGLYLLFRRSGAGAVVLALGVVSHWFLDALMHRPDMPVLPRGPFVGLSLWNSVPLTILAEALVFGPGIAVYLKTTRAIDRTGSWALWSLLALLTAIWAASIFGPPPPDQRAVEYSGLGLWLFVPWGWWIDRHRTIVDGRREAHA